MLESVIGLAAGILEGATGIGVGLVVTPLLILMGYQPSMALATGLLLLVVSKLVGAVSHYRMGHVRGRDTWILIVGGVVGAGTAWCCVHAWIFQSNPVFEEALRRATGAILLLTAATMIGRSRRRIAQKNERDQRCYAALLAAGAGSGASVAMTSLGSGSLLVPTLAIFTDWTVPQLAAGSNLFGLAVGLFSSALQARWGEFNWPMFSKVILGLLPGVVLGAVLSRHIEYRRFTFGISAISIFLGLRLLFK